MTNQTKEAARQILGDLSDIQAVVSLSGLADVNIKLASIREKAAFLMEDKKDPGEIVERYRQEASMALDMLSSCVYQNISSYSGLNDEELLRTVRQAEIFTQRARVYFERKNRYQEVSNGRN